jgi:hypothetical protein
VDWQGSNNRGGNDLTKPSFSFSYSLLGLKDLKEKKSKGTSPKNIPAKPLTYNT